MNLSLISLSILLFLVLILMILRAFKQISEPLLEVREAVKEMANGNFDYPLPQPSKRRDELTELVASLKLMRFRLERTLNYSRQLAERDGLTGVYNRRILDMTLVERVMAYQKNGTLFSLILLDIDRFKGYNDNYGHSEGDRILKHMATLVSKSIGDTDLFARYGGEEFTILTNNEQPEQLAEHLRRVIEENPLDAYQLTASFGVTQVREGDGPKDLLDRADEALYRAKSAGRNRVEVKV
jgi:diguanylate cyclase (GGDEF)-like protein